MVKRLWLLRHAKSSWEEPGLADHDRPLAPRGRKASKRIARWVSANGVQPELVLCSTAIRARATLDLISGALGSPVVRFEDGIYHATAEDLLERLRTVPDDVGDVLVVGHNPGLQELACVLAPPGPDALPTGALVELRAAIEAWQEIEPACARLAELILPRSLPR